MSNSNQAQDQAESWFPNAKTLNGFYKAKFSETSVGTRVNRYQDPPKEEATLCFKFEVLDTGDKVQRTFKASNSLKSQCVKFVKGMVGRTLEKEEISDPAILKTLIEEGHGKIFSIEIEPSDCGQYHNVIGIRPVVEVAP